MDPGDCVVREGPGDGTPATEEGEEQGPGGDGQRDGLEREQGEVGEAGMQDKEGEGEQADTGVSEVLQEEQVLAEWPFHLAFETSSKGDNVEDEADDCQTETRG